MPSCSARTALWLISKTNQLIYDIFGNGPWGFSAEQLTGAHSMWLRVTASLRVSNPSVFQQSCPEWFLCLFPCLFQLLGFFCTSHCCSGKCGHWTFLLNVRLRCELLDNSLMFCRIQNGLSKLTNQHPTDVHDFLTPHLCHS